MGYFNKDYLCGNSETEKSTSSASSYPMSSMLHLAEHVASSHQADLAHNFVQVIISANGII